MSTSMICRKRENPTGGRRGGYLLAAIAAIPLILLAPC